MAKRSPSWAAIAKVGRERKCSSLLSKPITSDFHCRSLRSATPSPSDLWLWSLTSLFKEWMEMLVVILQNFPIRSLTKYAMKREKEREKEEEE